MPTIYCRECRSSWQASAYPASTGPQGCRHCPNAQLFALDTSNTSAVFWNGGFPQPVNVRQSITVDDAFALAQAWGLTKGAAIPGGRLLAFHARQLETDLQNVVAMVPLTYWRFLLSRDVPLGDYLFELSKQETCVTLVATWKDPNIGSVAGLARNRS